MAKATRVALVPIPVPDEIVLCLTQREAEVLLHVCAQIGGQTEGPRGEMDNIKNALRGVRVRRSNYVTSHGGVYLDS